MHGRGSGVFIGVIGPGQCTRETWQKAYEVGREIAKRGGFLVCGGLGGVMEAAAKGAKEAGGVTVGIIPGVHRFEANPYIDVPIVTGMGHGRNVIVARSSDVLIAVEGGFGTLSEIALALKMGKPVVGLQTWDVSDHIEKKAHPGEAVEAAVELAQRAFKSMEQGGIQKE